MDIDLRFHMLFVLGIGHSGSTLLGRMLDMHPEVLCVGELLRLEEALANPAEKCSCGELVSACAFWKRWTAQLPEKVKRDYEQWDFELLERMRGAEGRKLLVDLSKTRSYRLSKRWRHAEVGYILLLRDPRGVVRSSVAKGQELSGVLKVHKKWIKRLEDFAKQHKSRCLVVHYEDLVNSPEQTISTICQFVGLNFVPELLTPDSRLHHFVRSSGSAYLKGTNQFKLDERWRRELNPEQITQISNYLKSVPIYRDRYQLAGA